MSRPFTDIQRINSSQPIKNGSTTTTTSFTGKYNTLNTYTKNTPTINTISSKYGDRFYNGIFVELVGDSSVIGG
jgi:hypothetical protein